MRRALMAAALALMAAGGRAGTLGEELGVAIQSARVSLDLRLARPGDSALLEVLEAASARGLKIRALLNPAESAGRRAAPRLSRARIEVRWSERSRGGWLIVDGRRAWIGAFDGHPDGQKRDAASAKLSRQNDAAVAAALVDEFERDWATAAMDLSESWKLKEQLESLPDPRESEPKATTKRRNL